MLKTSDMVEQLRRVEHFKHLPQEDLEAIISAGQVRHFLKGETIFNEGEPCAGMHVLLQGRVDLFKISPDGKISILNTLNPVIMFNEVAVLDGGLNPVCAVAEEETIVWKVNCDKFQQLLRQYPQIALGLLGVLARRNRLMLAQYGDLSFRSVTARVAKYLLTLSENGEKTINRSQHSIRNMAARVVTTPEAVSRTLKSFDENHIIAVDRKSIRVLGLERLQQLARVDCQ
jgi:CRP/FNR family transcriptional regulator